MPKDILKSCITSNHNSLLSCRLTLWHTLTPLTSPSSEAVSRFSGHKFMTWFNLSFSPEPDESNTHCISEVSGPVLRLTPTFFRQCVLIAKWPGREAGHWTPSSAEIKNVWSCTPLLPIQWLSNVTHDAQLSDVDSSLEVSKLNMSHAFCISYPSHLPWFVPSIWWVVHVMTLPISYVSLGILC